MGELQPIGHKLFVAFRYHHPPLPNRQEVTNQVTGSQSASGTCAVRRSLPGGGICLMVASLSVARWLVPYPSKGLISIVWLPVWL
jgi:hypothetical protein